ncbi:hypothetical protein N2152v2_006444 [Parachlorella kessleri]
MARPKGKTQQKGKQQASGKKRKQYDDFFEDDDEQPILASDDEAKVSDDEEEQEVEETAEEKRLRLAKDYLDQIKRFEAAEGTGADGDEEAPSDDEADGGAGTHAAVAARLRLDALESMGHLQRRLAHRLVLPALPRAAEFDPRMGGAAALDSSGVRFLRGHKLSVTALALTADDRTVYSVAKEGSILQTDAETGKRDRFDLGRAPGAPQAEPLTTGADWVRQGPRQSSRGSLLAAAVSSDGRYLAVGGGDRKVHVWDARSRQLVKAFPGHKDAVTGLAFRDGTHQLFSSSLDRSIKIWSLDDMAYVDTLFGHQSEVLGIDALRAERVVTCGADRTCRVWKIAEESQLIFRGSSQTIECCRYLTGSEWVSGSAGGTLELWSSMKKKPMQRIFGAHGLSGSLPSSSTAVPSAAGQGGAAAAEGQGAAEELLGAGTVGGEAASWIGAVASCRGSDLVVRGEGEAEGAGGLASGAGDGIIRLWALGQGKAGGSSKALRPLGGVPARGFVNGLAIARSGRFLVAGMGQEPRMGRWLRDAQARNGVLLHPLQLREQEGEE